MKVKKNIIVVLIGVLVFTLISCSTKKALEIRFDNDEFMLGIYGEAIFIPKTSAFDQSNIAYEVDYVVYDSDRIAINTPSNRLVIHDIDGYTIKYFIQINNTEYSSYTEIIVSSGKFDIKPIGTYTLESYEGNTVMLPQMMTEHEMAVTYRYSVRHKGFSVEIDSKNQIITQTTGDYDVTIIGTDQYGSTGIYEYTIETKEIVKGAVEIFDENWYVTKKPNQNLEIVSTADEGIGSYNHENQYVGRMNIESTMTYPNIFLNPIYPKSYYEALSQEGYTHISFWVYMKSEKNIPHQFVQKFTFGSYGNKNIEFVSPNVWTLVSLSLAGEEGKMHQSSFLDAYDAIKNQELAPVVINNDPVWGGEFSEDNMVIYMSHLYVTKIHQDIHINQTALENVENVGDTLDFNQLSDLDTINYVTFNGVRTKIQDRLFLFTENGNYQFELILVDNNLHGHKIIEIEIKSTYEIQITENRFEMIEGNAFELSRLDARLYHEGIKQTQSSLEYEVHYFGKKIDIMDEQFIFESSGVYHVTIKSSYMVNDMEFIVSKVFEVDLYTLEDKHMIFKYIDETDSKRNVKAYQPYGSVGWASDPSMYGFTETEVDGYTGNLYYVESGRHSIYVTILPLYSKNHYEQLRIENSTSKVCIDYYIDDVSGVYPLRPHFFFGERINNQVTNEWIKKEISLEVFINYYDSLLLLWNDSSLSNPDNNPISFIGVIAFSGTNRETTIYLKPIYIVEV